MLLDDHSRVVLGPYEGDPSSDYINASFVNVSSHVGFEVYVLSFTIITAFLLVLKWPAWDNE